MISVGYTLSAVVISLAYNYLQNWRSVTLCLLVLVSALILFLTVFFLEDSPSSMIKSRNVAYTCSILNRIGKINKGEENIISEEEVEEYFEELAK